jgi:hypothetical protein
VHADSRPPRDAIEVVRKTLAHQGTVLGGFRTVIKHKDRVLGFMTFHHFVKTYYLPLLTRPLSFLRYAGPKPYFEPCSQSTGTLLCNM